ncbi:hypothetical protein K438DRAFT_1959780 [Mycena galopus ATCC 62051]|nr:hypothetical protein K438DRAFT_1959780 [Mycena galopus ATCC 62051]
MQNLPQELVDRIVDHLASELVDEHSEELDSDWKEHFGEGGSPELARIASCGLVSRAFLPRSRFHLFSSTRLSNDYDSGADNINSFLDIVAASPLPLSLVQFLDLDLLGGSFNNNMRRLFNLPLLTSLRLRTADDHYPLDDFYPCLTPHLPLLAINSPLLTSFHLDLNADLPLPFLIHLVSNLPSLEHLTIGKARGDNYDIINPDCETVPQPGPFPPRLLTLDLRLSCGVGLFFSWLLSLAALPVPRFLGLSLQLKDRDFPIEASLRPVEDYLRRVGGRLESFSLSLSREFLDESDYSSIEHSNLERRWLNSASRLGTLTFAPSQGASEALPEILGFLPSSRLSALTIVALELEKFFPWGPMDQALSHPRFKTLQRFALEDAAAFLKEQVTLLDEDARAAMPLANARGILHSRFNTD